MSVDAAYTERVHADPFGTTFWPFLDIDGYVKLAFIKRN